jgi:transposase
MTPETMFHELLGLGLSWVVEECVYEKNTKIVLHVKETERLWEQERCPKCTGRVSCYDHTEPLKWRHLNCFEHECEIECRLPRGRCTSCEHTYRVRPPWEGKSKHFTKEFEAFTLVLAREMPVKKVADILKETDTRLWRMILAHVDAAYHEADFRGVTCVGVDEFSRCRGHQYLSIFADLLQKRILFATKGKDQTTWDRFSEALSEHNGRGDAIQEVSMDMSASYIAGAARHAPNAEIVFDKYHMIANVNEAVDETRRNEMRTGGWEVRKELKETRWVWLKNPENLTEKEIKRLDRVDLRNRCTAKAYQMRLTLQDIYRIDDVEVAGKKLRAWCRWVRTIAHRHTALMFVKMVKCATMIEVHFKGILAHWKHRLTNGFMEGMNSVYSAVKRKARGYRSERYLIAMLYFISGKLRIPAT